MKKVFLIFLSIGLLVQANFALPRFALMQKDRCIDCHVNPTGGFMRNENGFFFGKNVVGMISPREKDFPLSPKLTENISFGLDYRSQFIYSAEKKRGDFHDMSGSVYINAAVSEKIDLLARYDFVQAIWEGVAIARILPNNSYIKVGSFVPNFGIRIDDHTAYTRGGDFGLLFSAGFVQGMIYHPLYFETGIEVGANLSDFGLLTASVGKGRQNGVLTVDPTFTARIEFNPDIENIGLMFGGSFASTKVRLGPERFSTSLYGVFAGVGGKRFALLGEYDVAKDYIGNGISSTAMMIEISYQLMVGLEAVARYDRFDPIDSINDDEHAHLIFGFEFFPYSFVELRPQYRIKLETPDVSNNAFVLQFHFWY